MKALTHAFIYDWFVCYKAQEIKECMITNVRKKAGLAENEKFYTDTSESVNRMLKDKESVNRMLKDKVKY